MMKMQEKPPPNSVVISHTMATLVLICGLAIFSGRALDLVPLPGGWHGMKANTAAGFILLSSALWIRWMWREKKTAGVISAFMGCVVASIGALALAAYAFEWQSGIDQLLLKESPRAEQVRYPGRMAPNTGLGLFFGGIAVALLGLKWWREHPPAQYVGLIIGFLGLQNLIAILYGARPLVNVFSTYTPMTDLTAICFILLSIAVVADTWNEGLTRRLTPSSPGGLILYRLLPVAIVFPVVLGWLRVEAEDLGWFNSDTGAAVHSTLMIVLFGVLSLVTAFSVNNAEDKRRAAERARQRSEALFRRLAESDILGIITYDRTGRVKTANNAFLRLLGLDEGAVERELNLHDLTPDRYESSDRRAIERIAREGTVLPYEKEFLHKNGSLVSVVVGAAGLPDDPDSIIGFVLDVTEQRRQETELQRAHDEVKQAGEHLRGIIDGTTDLITALDTNFKIIAFNKVAEQEMKRILDVDLKPGDSMTAIEKNFPERLGKSREVWKRTFAGEQVVELQEWIDPRFGSLFFEAISSPMRDAEGHIIGGVSVTRNVTERIQVQREMERINVELEQAGSTLRGIIDGTPDMVTAVDTDFRLMAFNKATELEVKRLLNLTFNVGDDIRTITDEYPERTAESIATWSRIFAGESIVKLTDWDDPNEGRLYFESAYNPIRNPDGEVIGGVQITRNVTERVRAQHTMERLNEELERRVQVRTAELQASNKELEAFSYSVSHDLRAPLRSIDGFSQAVMEDYKDKLDEEGTDLLARIRAATQRMGKLIDDLLQLSRLSRAELNRRPTNMSELARNIVRDLSLGGPESRVEWVIQEGVFAQADPRLIRSVLENFLVNAYKFSSKRDTPRIEFGSTRLEGEDVYFVRDNGVGFDMAYVGKLFGAFQRLHPAKEYPGTGIGLATVHRVIRRHGGRVWAEAEPNKGATFYFTLPKQGE